MVSYFLSIEFLVLLPLFSDGMALDLVLLLLPIVLSSPGLSNHVYLCMIMPSPSTF